MSAEPLPFALSPALGNAPSGWSAASPPSKSGRVGLIADDIMLDYVLFIRPPGCDLQCGLSRDMYICICLNATVSVSITDAVKSEQQLHDAGP